MGKRWADDYYQDKRGVWWARVDGKRQTPNTRQAAKDLLHDMSMERDRALIAANDPRKPPTQGLEVVVLRGVPGCGKTTWAKALIAEQPWYKRVSRDDLRAMFDDGRYSPDNERFIREMRSRIIRELLDIGSYPIVDDTNLKERDIREIEKAAITYFDLVNLKGWHGIPIRIVEFDTPLEECIRRDALREKPVGEERIREMYYGYYGYPPDEYMEDARKALTRFGDGIFS